MHISVLDENGNTADSWISGTLPHTVRNIVPGKTYTLRETVAPDGYTIAADTTFTVDADGNVTSDGTVTDSGIIIIFDKPQGDAAVPTDGRTPVSGYDNPGSTPTVPTGGYIVPVTSVPVVTPVTDTTSPSVTPNSDDDMIQDIPVIDDDEATSEDIASGAGISAQESENTDRSAETVCVIVIAAAAVLTVSGRKKRNTGK